MSKNLYIFTALVAIGLLMAGCGRKGGLEAPPSARTAGASEDASSQEENASSQETVQQDRAFILDRLIQ